MAAADLWIDGHLDLAYAAVNGRDVCVPCPDGLDACVSLPALRDAGVTTAFGTIFTAPGEREAAGYAGPEDLDGAAAAGDRQMAVYERWEKAGEIRLIRSIRDLDSTPATPRIVALMEGADPIRDPDDVARWHARGLRIVGLTWSAGTRYAGGNASGGPLTDRGRALVRALDDAGIAHDVSHLSDAAFDDLLALARGPVVASHSNCRALLGDGERHLRDEQITAIAERGGVVGLNLYAGFLATGRPATIDDCVDHVEHVAAVMGHRAGVALGSDMDGGFTPDDLPVGLEHPRHLDALAAELGHRGWSEAEVGGFRRGNWLRFLERTLG